MNDRFYNNYFIIIIFSNHLKNALRKLRRDKFRGGFFIEIFKGIFGHFITHN